jgi:hypothetical protein
MAELPEEGGSIFGRGAGPDYRIDARGCWVWLKSLTENGYPGAYAHRMYWEIVHGPRPDDWHIHHLCRNTRCVNPEHLEAISPRDHLMVHHLEEAGRTLDDVRALRSDREAGLSFSALAEKHGVPRSTVYYWLKSSWHELLGPVGEPQPPARECAHCGDSYATTHRAQLYCSRQCRIEANWRRQKERARTRRAA